MFVRFYIAGISEDSPELYRMSHGEALKKTWASQKSIVIDSADIYRLEVDGNHNNAVRVRDSELSVKLTDESAMVLAKNLMRGTSCEIEAVAFTLNSRIFGR